MAGGRSYENDQNQCKVDTRMAGGWGEEQWDSDQKLNEQWSFMLIIIKETAIFSLQKLYQNQRKKSSESLTEGENYHLYLFFSGEEPYMICNTAMDVHHS